MNICNTRIHLGVDPDVTAESSTGFKKRMRPMNDEIYTRQFISMIDWEL